MITLCNNCFPLATVVLAGVPGADCAEKPLFMKPMPTGAYVCRSRSRNKKYIKIKEYFPFRMMERCYGILTAKDQEQS
jgi:hypothetical protein